MRKYKHIQFADGIDLPLADFKKVFGSHLIGLNDNEVKEAHKIATNGNISRATNKRKETNKPKDKD